MKWTQFKDKMPEEGDRIFVCGKIDTDPLEQSQKYNAFFEFALYKRDRLDSDSGVCEPNPNYYWIYLEDIPTPFDKDK